MVVFHIRLVARLSFIVNVSIVIRLHASQTLPDAPVKQIKIKPTVPVKFIKL